MLLSNNKKLKIGISIGDINGIGIEIFLKTFLKKDILNFFTPILFGSYNICCFYIKKFNLNNNFKFNIINNIKNITDYKINILNILNKQHEKELKIEPGIPTYYGKICAINSIKIAIKNLINNYIDVLVTLPVNKKLLSNKYYSFIGHTEYLKKYLVGDPLMIMVYKKLKIALLTNHIPIKKISDIINKKLIINKVKILHNSLIKDFNIKNPKIAILGFNPHSGDDGLIGNEEIKKIQPAIKELNKFGYLISGPYSSDGLFRNYNRYNFDAILAIYHDQGLIPFKIISNNHGINFTAGLNYIRTSPDHGVAYDIAGKGIANENSFINSIYKAIEIYYNRYKY